MAARIGGGQGLRCVLYDRRGHGRSDRPASGYDFDTLADDLSAVIDHFDLRDITLIGHSLGSRELVRYLTFIRGTPDGQANRDPGGDRGVMMS